MIEDGRLILTALEAALAAPEVWESTRKTFDQVLRSPRLHSLYRFLLGSFEREEDKREVRREFANIMTMHMGQEVDTILQIMESYYGPLINEGGPTGDPKFGRTLRGTQSLQRPLQDGFDGDRSAGRVLGQLMASEYVRFQKGGQPSMVESMLVKAVDQCRAQSSGKLTLKALVSLVQVKCWMVAQFM